MRDRIFFPLVLLLVLGMTGTAIWPGLFRLPDGPVAGDGVNYERVTIQNRYLNKVIAGGDAKTELVRENGRILLYIEADAGALAADPESGPHFRLASDMELQFSGMRVRCTVRMRPAETRGAMQAQVNYLAGRAGESGWQRFDLQPEFTDFSFVFDVPEHIGEQGFDYFAIRPVVPEKTRALLVERIVFERLGPSRPES